MHRLRESNYRPPSRHRRRCHSTHDHPRHFSPCPSLLILSFRRRFRLGNHSIAKYFLGTKLNAHYNEHYRRKHCFVANNKPTSYPVSTEGKDLQTKHEYFLSHFITIANLVSLCCRGSRARSLVKETIHRGKANSILAILGKKGKSVLTIFE